MGHGLRPLWGKAWSLRTSRELGSMRRGHLSCFPSRGCSVRPGVELGAEMTVFWGWDKPAGFPLIPVAHLLEHVSEERL